MSKRKLSLINKDTNVETVTFNVGGQKYEISRSQFDKYPDSMLAKTVSDRWLQDPSQEIFIDRDGSLFRHVLSFIRDGKVFLWHGITREEFREELGYYGIECDDDISEYIHEKLPISINSIGGHIDGVQNQNHFNNIAIYCMKAYCRGRFRLSGFGLPKPDKWYYSSESKVAQWELWNCENDIDDYKSIDEAYMATESTHGKCVAEANKILSKVPLKLIYMSNFYGDGDAHCYSFQMTEIVD